VEPMEYSMNVERKSRAVGGRGTDGQAPWVARKGVMEAPGVGKLEEFWDRIWVRPRRKLVGLGGTMRQSQRESRFRSQMDALRVERKWLIPVVVAAVVSILLLLLATFSVGSGEREYSVGEVSVVGLLPVRESGRSQNALGVIAEVPFAELPPPPRLAYLISGTKGDGQRMQRTLQAVYHPRNYYLLHLDLEAPPRERVTLARYVKNEVVFQQNGNVYVVGKANLVTYRGPTMIAATLHGAAILLRKAKDWDWFINLSAADYPLVTQDGTHVFGFWAFEIISKFRLGLFVLCTELCD
jgi:hypothetical protein